MRCSGHTPQVYSPSSALSRLLCFYQETSFPSLLPFFKALSIPRKSWILGGGWQGVAERYTFLSPVAMNLLGGSEIQRQLFELGGEVKSERENTLIS